MAQMFRLFIFSLCHLLVHSYIDLNCTEVDATGVLHLAPSAIKNCQDPAGFIACQQMFGAGGAPTANTAPTADLGRAARCYQVGLTPSEQMKAAAIDRCPLYCGFCCVTPPFNCPNAPAPRLVCSTITDDMCDSILWRELIAEDCPGACGFCLLGGCIDAAPDCVTQPTICGNAAMANFTQTNCRRTCGRLYPRTGVPNQNRRPMERLNQNRRPIKDENENRRPTALSVRIGVP